MQHRDSFIDSLYGNQEDHCIPTEYDWFSPLLGDWEFKEQSRMPFLI